MDEQYLKIEKTKRQPKQELEKNILELMPRYGLLLSTLKKHWMRCDWLI